jgi:hypothetical protein
MRQLCKGNVAVIKGAVLAGCRACYKVPPSPQPAKLRKQLRSGFPEVGGAFVQ